MSRQLDLFFFIGSTYTYLTVSRVQDAASRESISIRWRPFSVRTIMAEQNNIPCDRYASETQVARELGIFGSPTFVSGSEIFWGDDRLEDAIDWSRSKPLAA